MTLISCLCHDPHLMPLSYYLHLIPLSLPSSHTSVMWLSSHTSVGYINELVYFVIGDDLSPYTCTGLCCWYLFSWGLKAYTTIVFGYDSVSNRTHPCKVKTNKSSGSPEYVPGDPFIRWVVHAPPTTPPTYNRCALIH